MAKKRKADKTFSKPTNTKIAKYDIDETFDDSQDEFFAEQDKILLDETADSKRRRRLIDQEKSLQPSDEEILGYQDYEEEEDEDLSEEEDEEVVEGDDVYQDLKSLPQKKSRLATRDDEEQDEELSDEENWGGNRADYFNADTIETEADAIEEETEAKRLHQKQLKNMTEADYGFDEEFWAETKKDIQKGGSMVEKLPEAQIPDGATGEQKLEILANRYPELQPLAEDFEQLQKVKEELDAAAAAEKSMKFEVTLTAGLPVAVKRNALTAYLGAISMYFAILASKASKATTDPFSRTITAMPPIELHEHAIIGSLSRAKELWERVGNVETARLIPVEPPQEPKQLNVNKSQDKLTQKKKMPTSEPIRKASPPPQESKKNKKPAKATTEAPKNLPIEAKSKKLRSENPRKKYDAGDLQLLVSYTQRTTPANTDAPSDNNSDMGDEILLTASEALEKQRKRKSLRFYTSQISSKAHKRGHASREAGGDDDLPYKERQRDRIQRLNREAEARGRQEADDLDDDNNEDERLARGDGDVNDEYYDTLFDAQKRKKAQRRAKADAYAEAARLGAGAEVHAEETVGTDGKRAITYAIAKNKGLAPKRKKEVRNPRVKKRKKFDEKMKKLGSIRQVYKGGEGRGGYGGELTGIKTNVVKSVKL